MQKSDSEGCALYKKYLDDNLVFDVSLYKTFSFIFGRGLDFGSASCVSKMCFYTIFSSFHIFDYIPTYIQLAKELKTNEKKMS